MAKATVSGNYQYSEANAKDAYLLRSFGWLIGKRSEHENRKGEKVYTIRRDLQIAGDPVIRKTEKQIGAIAGGVFFLKGLFAPLDEIIDTLNTTIRDTIDSVLNDFDLAGQITEYVRYLFLGIAGISFISIFINAARYRKRRVCPKRKYAKKYNSIARGALKEGAARLYLLKMENGALMTQSDRRMNELGITMRRVMDNGEDYE